MADDVEVVAVQLERLGRARRERALAAHHLSGLGQDVPLPGRGEVDQHVAEHHHVEHAQVAERVQQVHALEAHQLPGLVLQHRNASVAVEVLLAQPQRQAAAHRDGVVAAGLGDRERVSADVGREDLELLGAEAAQLARALHLAQQDRDRVGLLAGRARRRPDRDLAAAVLAGALDRLGHDHLAHRLPERHVAEPRRLVRGHVVDDAVAQGRARAASLLVELAEARAARLDHHLAEARLDQVHLRVLERDPAPGFDQPAQEVELVALEGGDVHFTFAMAWIRPARSSSATTSSASPPSITERGIPYTAQLAWSWAMHQPPRARTAFTPSSPSAPMPVMTTQSALPGTASASDLNITSTDGRNEFTGGFLSLRRTNGSASPADTSRCLPPGATSTSPLRSGRPSSASRTRSLERRSSDVASDAVKRAGMCCTISTGTRRSSGSFGISSASALGPPVELPIATRSIAGTFPRAPLGFTALVGRERAARPSRKA